MKQPLIVAVGRQYGSSGRLVGAKLAERLGVDFYDKEKLMTIARSLSLIHIFPPRSSSPCDFCL